MSRNAGWALMGSVRGTSAGRWLYEAILRGSGNGEKQGKKRSKTTRKKKRKGGGK